MKFKNECLSGLYINSLGKHVAVNEKFSSDMNDELRKLVKEAKLSVIMTKELIKEEKVKEEPKMSFKKKKTISENDKPKIEEDE